MNTQPLKWHGGKSYLASWIHLLAPPRCTECYDGYTHRNIVFAGGLGEFWNWPFDEISETVNDADNQLTTFYYVLGHPELFPHFQAGLELTPFASEYWERARHWLTAKLPAADVEEFAVWRAINFFVAYRQSRQGLARDFATPTTRTRRGMNENVSAWLSAVEGLPECHERLRRVEIRNLDFIKFIRAYDHRKALFYCDPPYLHVTRKTTGEYGAHEMSHRQHARLLALLGMIRGKFMLSGYRSELYDRAAEWFGWTRHEREIDNKASSSKTKEKRIECVWVNY